MMCMCRVMECMFMGCLLCVYVCMMSGMYEGVWIMGCGIWSIHVWCIYGIMG